ncbi:MAG: hypothetical protein RL514_3489 [Verrucomicrobiota bacterium]|jgi:transposase-like protein
MPLLTTKDLARKMAVHPKTVKRWWRKLKVKPDACSAHHCHRWTPAAAARLLKRWRAYWEKRGQRAPEATTKFAGLVKRCREKQQLRLKLTFQ